MGIADQISTEAAALQQRWDTEERWRGVVRPYTAEEVVRLRGRIRETHGFAIEAATKLWDLLATEDYVATLGCLTGQPGGRMRQGGAARDLPLGLAGGRRREPVGTDLPRSVALPRQLGPGRRAAHQQRVAPRRSDRVGGGPRGRLPRSDRGRCRGRVRRPAERLRADDLDDQGRRRGRALRGPALEREEVRTPRWQGADPDLALPADADRRAPGRRRPGCADAGDRAHRRAGRHAAHERHRRARPRVRHRRSHRGRLLPRHPGHRRGDRAGARLRAAGRRALVRDLDAGPRRGAAVRRGGARGVPGQDCSPTTARRRSTGRSPWTTRRSRRSRRSSPGWATGSSSSRWPGSTR